MKLRLRFEKTGDMKFIGHLDLMRYFQKVMRRANVPIRYSQGFSPHQLMSFALPLGIGVESTAEYLDLETEEIEDLEALKDRMNNVQAEGIRINGIAILPDNAKPAMSQVAAADFEITAREAGGFSPEELVQLFSEASEFLVEKKTKKSVTMLNMKELVYDFRCIPEGFRLKIAAGSEKNVKPELFLNALFDRAGLTFRFEDFRILRTEIYARSADGSFVELLKEN